MNPYFFQEMLTRVQAPWVDFRRSVFLDTNSWFFHDNRVLFTDRLYMQQFIMHILGTLWKKPRKNFIKYSHTLYLTFTRQLPTHMNKTHQCFNICRSTYQQKAKDGNNILLTVPGQSKTSRHSSKTRICLPLTASFVRS